MTRFWPVAEPAQADYERLRADVVSGRGLPDELASARFLRRGLAGLIAWPLAKPVFAAVVAGAQRPAWTPYGDPRRDALAATYRVLLAEARVPENQVPVALFGQASLERASPACRQPAGTVRAQSGKTVLSHP
jgi:hypothetical protein